MMDERKSDNTLNPMGELPDKPKLETIVTERKVVGDSEENRMVREVGRRLCPDGHEHVASYAVHVYKPTLGLGAEVRSQNLVGSSETREATATEANWALQQLSISVAKSYGWEPKKHQRLKTRQV